MIKYRKYAHSTSNEWITFLHGAGGSGAVLEFNFKANCLLFLGNIIRSFIPYIFLYKIFIFAIIPNHKTSRNLFINEAKKIYSKEFHRLKKSLTI